MSKTKIMLIDGNSLLYRAFYALPLLHNSEGVYTNAVYGFLTMFNRVKANEQPTHIVIAFDKGRETFRNGIYQEYKATRKETPEELSGQFQLLRDVLDAANVFYIEMQGYEADDIIGTLSKRACDDRTECVIVTGDNDSLQLVSEHVHVLMTRKGITDIEHYDPLKVKEKWEVEPEQMIEIKALMGDASDNIPGVPGVGAKTAVKLIKEFHSLENLYENLNQVKGAKLLEKLTQYRHQAFVSRELGTIVRDMDIDYRLEDYRIQEPDVPQLIELYKKLGFNNFLRALEQEQPAAEPDQAAEVEVLNIEGPEVLDGWEQQQTVVSLLVQADYHHPMWANLQGLYLEREGQVYHLDLEQDQQARLAWIKPWLEEEKAPKQLHNAKFAQVLLWRQGINLKGIQADTMLMAYVKDPVFNGDELNATLKHYMNLQVDKDQPAVLAFYIRPLAELLAAELPEDSHSLYYDVELPLSTVLAAMEYCGIKVQRETLAAISDELAIGIARDEEKIFSLAGSQFNINSPRQLGQVLFEDLGLPALKKTKTGYSTDAAVLEQLYEEHEIIPYLLDYRQLTKLKSTYVDALQSLIHPQTGRVHTMFKQAQTATGRLSSVEPNLQNIPIRMEEGRRVRRAFTAGDADHVLLSADYSQIDLRSLAHISGDENLIDTFKQGIDIHTRTASQIFKVPLDAVTYELRYRAKAVNFGIIYGISDFGLARDTGVSRKEARIYIENYLDTYPGVRQYMEDIVSFGREKGYVETILGRRRYLPDLRAKNKTVQAFARRVALNTPIQGSSADIIKLAMNQVCRKLQEHQFQARMLLQVHDELVLEVPRQEIDKLARLLKDCMENAYRLAVPLEVSLKRGDDWYHMEEIHLSDNNYKNGTLF